MKKQLLANVEYANLLQINWNEQKIQNNFKIIVDALADQEKDKKDLRDDLDLLKDQINFIKQLIKDSGNTINTTNITNHNVNVEHKQGNSEKSAHDPFKIRQTLQKLQKEIKDMNSKQTDTDLMLDKIQELQEKLKEDLKNIQKKQKQVTPQVQNNAKKEQSKQRISQTNTRRISEASNSGLTKKQKEVSGNKQKSQTSLQDLESQITKSNKVMIQSVQVPQVPQVPQMAQSSQLTQFAEDNKNLNSKLTDLLERIDELKSDNLKINAKLNHYDQAIQSLRKAPIPSKLKSTEAPTTKPAQQKPQVQSDNKDQNGKVDSQLEDFKQDLASLQDQLNKYYLDANTLRLCYEEMKLWIGDLKKADNKKDGLINDINSKISQIIQNHKDDKDRIDQELKEIRTTILKSALKQQKVVEQVKPETPSAALNDRRASLQEFDENYKDKINDKLSRLQALLMQAATQSDLERVRAELKQSIQESNHKIQNVKQEVKDINKKLQENELDQQSQNSQIRKLQNDFASLSGLINDKFAAGDKKNNITNSKIQEVKKNLQQIKEDLEFYKQNFNKPVQRSSGIHPLPGNKGEGNSNSIVQGRLSGEFDGRRYDELKKEILNKLHDNKTELFNALKDFQRRSNNKNTFEQDIAMLFDKIGEIKLFLSKKADAEDTKKSILYLEKKMCVAFASLAREDENTEDARAAKKNWFCLSCDKVLQNYNGKVGKHIVWDALGTNNKFNKTTMGVDDSKKYKQSLPTLKR